jgi:hypothetical protein
MGLDSEEFNEDPTMMGMGLDDSWRGLDINPQFSADLPFDTTAFGLQNEQSFRSSGFSSTSTDCGFNQHFPPTFSSANFSFDTPGPPGFEKFSSLSSTLTTSDFTPIFPNYNPSFSVPSMVAPALVNASQPSQFVGASSFMQFQPTTALAPVFPHTGALFPSPSNASSPTVVPGNAPQHIPHTGALLPSPSNASSPTVVPGNAPQHIPATSNASPQPTVSPPSHGKSNQPAAAPSVASDASFPPRAQNTASFQHDQAAAISQPVHTGAKNVTTPLSPLFNSDSPLSQLAGNTASSQRNQAATISPLFNSDSESPLFQLAGNAETSALSSVSGISSSVPFNQADNRRSGGNPVPSKRHEQMNEIDGKAKNKTTASPHIEKENIHSTTPEWTIASHNHLLKSDLGKDWTACVQAWFELEQELGYGSKAGAKVFLLIFFSSSSGWHRI